ncbi:MAG: dihydrofolate reductase [Agarilytica sp.]
MDQVKLAIIVAKSENSVIGKDNALPWHLPEDLKFFKRVTMGHPIIMGRLTYESIGRPLPGRANIVVTRHLDWQAEGVQIAHSLEEAVMLAENSERPDEWVMVIGGANLYAQALPKCQRLYLTQVHAKIDGDAYFPEVDDHAWLESARESHEKDSKNPYDYSFLTWDRK